MTQEEKAKAYDEALEKAKAHINSKGIGDTVDLCKHLFSELNESEDEKVIRTLFFLCKDHDWLNGATKEECLNWLEKRKENSKSADSIPSDCVSDAKCEDRWHKTANSLPDNGRDVLAKDALGNYLIASFDGAQWFVSVYDGQDHPVLHTPPILEWCDIETCEESLHISETCKENADSFTDEDERIRKEMISFLRSPFIKENLTDEKVAPWLDWLEKQKEPTTEELYAEAGTTENEYIANTMKMVRAMREKQKEQKPAEWSEEDEKIISNIRHLLFGLAFENGGVDVNGDYCKDVYIQADDFLKSLRPSWRPSDEQMNCLCAAVDAAIRKHNESVSGYKPARVLKSLYEQLKKL